MTLVYFDYFKYEFQGPVFTFTHVLDTRILLSYDVRLIPHQQTISFGLHFGFGLRI